MNTSEGERREAQRFPMDGELRFRLLGKRSQSTERTGRALNISSNGILFSTDEPLPAGAKVELSVAWPASLEDGCMLKFVARGRIVRVEADGRAALGIEQYEFRTTRRRAA